MERTSPAAAFASGTTIEAVNSSTSITLSANATASGSQSLTATSFTIQLPLSLTDGSISLFVEAVDPAGNQSTASNTLTVTIVSVASDYNGDSYSDAALYSRSTVSFTGTLTSGSPLVTGLSSLTGLVTGVTVTGTGVPSGTTIERQHTNFTGMLATGSSLVTGLTGTTGLFAGENVTGTGIPSGTTIKTVNSSTSITLSANATVSGSRPHHDHHHAVGERDGQRRPEPHRQPGAVARSNYLGRPGESCSFLVHERHGLRPVQRHSLPGRLRWRRSYRSGVLPVQHRDLVYR